MPSRSFIALAIVAVVSVTACIGVTGLRPDPDARTHSDVGTKFESSYVFPDLRGKTDDVSDVVVSRRGQQFRLHKKRSGWLNEGVGGFPADADRIEKTIDAIAALVYLAPKTRRPELYAKLGVEKGAADAASTQLTLKDAKGVTLADVIVGRQKGEFAGKEVYIRLPADDRAWLARGAIDVNSDAIAWSDSLVVDIPRGDIVSLSHVVAGQTPYSLILKTPPSPDLTIANLPPGTIVNRQFQIDYLAGVMEGVQMRDARYDATPNAKSTCAIEVQTRAGLVVGFDIQQEVEDDATWVSVSSATTESTVPTAAAVAEAERIKRQFGDWQLRLPGKIWARCQITLDDIIGNAG